jgi:YesN/AraC family two-component response regulator
MAEKKLSTQCICLVDDEENILRAMKRALAMAGFSNVQSFTTWRTCEELMGQGPVDLLLLDITMPGVSGRDALVLAREKWPDTPVAMATGVNDAAVAVDCMKNGACDYLIKPISAGDLVSFVQNILLCSKLLGISCGAEIPERSSKLMNGMIDEIHDFHPTRLVAPDAVSGKDRELADQVIAFLSKPENYTSSGLTLSIVAAQIGSNTTYLSRVVNTMWKMNFRSLLNTIRLAVFVEKIKSPGSSSMSFEGLAQAVGFSRPSTFYSAFKSRFGTTPGHWLNSCQ